MRTPSLPLRDLSLCRRSCAGGAGADPWHTQDPDCTDWSKGTTRAHAHTRVQRHAPRPRGVRRAKRRPPCDGPGAFTWHEADLLGPSSGGAETRDVLGGFWEVEHGHPEARVRPGKLGGQGAQAACGRQRRTLRPGPLGPQKTPG